VCIGFARLKPRGKGVKVVSEGNGSLAGDKHERGANENNPLTFSVRTKVEGMLRWGRVNRRNVLTDLRKFHDIGGNVGFRIHDYLPLGFVVKRADNAEYAVILPFLDAGGL